MGSEIDDIRLKAEDFCSIIGNLRKKQSLNVLKFVTLKPELNQFLIDKFKINEEVCANSF
jgi:hypothetical protein